MCWCVANLLLNPGWSRSWQAAEVRRTATSSFVSTVCRLHRWIIPYICVRGVWCVRGGGGGEREEFVYLWVKI